MWIEILIVLTLLILTLVNLHYLNYFKSKVGKANKIEGIDNYYKLDAKIEFQKYLLLAIISIATFFGIKEFNDLSINADKIKSIENSFENLNNLYIEAQTKLNQIVSRHAEFDKSIQVLEKDLLVIDFKVKDATRQLPEPNIVAISKLIAQTYIAIILEHGPYMDHVAYSEEYIEKETEKIIRLLTAAGLTNSEAQDYLREVKKNTPKIEDVYP